MELIGKIGFANLAILVAGVYLMLLGCNARLWPKILRGKVFVIVISALMLLWSVSAVVRIVTTPSPGKLVLDEIRGNIHPPTDLDTNARIDDIILEDNDTKLVWLMTINVAQRDAAAITEAMEDQIKLQACEEGEMSLPLRMGISVEVRFNDRTGALISSVTIRPGDCNFMKKPAK